MNKHRNDLKCLFKLTRDPKDPKLHEHPNSFNRVYDIKYVTPTLLHQPTIDHPSPHPCPHLLRRLRFWGRGENITGSVRTGLELPDSSECTGAPLLLEGTSKQPEQPAMGAGLQGMQADTLSILTNQIIRVHGTQANRNTTVTTHTQS